MREKPSNTGARSVTGMHLSIIKTEHKLQITLVTEEGEYHFKFGMTKARQLLRALYLQVGVDPRLGTKKVEEENRRGFTST